MWCFDRIKIQAIKRIDALKGVSPVEKIVLAEKARVEEWLLPAYISLVEREEPISIQEARKLISLGETPVGHVIGMDIPSLLAQARERHYRNSQWQPISRIVEDLFGYLVGQAMTRTGTPLY